QHLERDRAAAQGGEARVPEGGQGGVVVVDGPDGGEVLLAGRVALAAGQPARQQAAVAAVAPGQHPVVEGRVDLVAEEDEQAAAAVDELLQLRDGRLGQRLDVGQHHQRVSGQVLAGQAGGVGG